MKWKRAGSDALTVGTSLQQRKRPSGGNDDDGPFESCKSLRENGLEDDDAGHDGWSMQAAGRELDSSI